MSGDGQPIPNAKKCVLRYKTYGLRQIKQAGPFKVLRQPTD